MFKIGDNVRCLNTDQVYDEYADAAAALGLTAWVCYEFPSPDVVYTVINIAPHLTYPGSVICAIEHADTQFMVDAEGLCSVGAERQFKVSFLRTVEQDRYRVFIADCEEQAEKLFKAWADGIDDSRNELLFTEEL